MSQTSTFPVNDNILPLSGVLHKFSNSPLYHPRNTQKRGALCDPVMARAKHYGRVVDPLVSFTAILNWGQRSERSRYIEEFVAIPEDSCTRRQRSRFDLVYLTIEFSALEIHGYAGGDPEKTNNFARKLEHARGTGRSDDTECCKFGIADWLPELARIPKYKDQRGFNNIATGRLLVPIGVDWDDEEQRRLFQTKNRRIGPSDSPTFFWRNLALNPKDVCDGFLRHEIAFKAYRHIFISPSSALYGESSRSFNGNGRRKGNASKNGVTIESIAYVHFQVHFALSERETLDIKSDEVSYIVFYDHIVRFLHDHKEQPKSARKVSDLIEWWNQRIFPGYRVDSALTSGLNTLYPSTSLFSLALESQSGSADQSVVKNEADEP